MLLILPLRWSMAMFLAAAIHECCHLLCLRLCGVPVWRIHLDLHGAVIETAPLLPMQEVLCAAAGPVGSFLCLVFAQWFPPLTLCGFLQGIYNLLPVYPLDGGRMLHGILHLIVPNRAEVISKCCAELVLWLLFLPCLILYCRTDRMLFLYLGGYFLLRIILSRKTPCNRVRN